MNSETTNQIGSTSVQTIPRPGSRPRRSAPQPTCASLDLTRTLVMHFELPSTPSVRERLTTVGLDPWPTNDRTPIVVSVIAGTVRDVHLHIAARQVRFVETNGHDQPARPVVMIAHLASHQRQSVWRPLHVSTQGAESAFWLQRFGVPAHPAHIELNHNLETGELTGSSPSLAWRGQIDAAARFAPPSPGTLDHRLLSPVGLYTADRWVQRRLDFTPMPWHVAHVQVECDPASLTALLDLPTDVKVAMIAAHFAPGLTNMHWLRPRCVNGPACAFLP